MQHKYTRVAVLLHWLLATAIVLTFIVGSQMSDMPMSVRRLQMFSWHKWAGICILVLSAVRLLWRLFNKPPADVPMSTLQRRLAHAVHWALYVLFFLTPLAGWAYSSAAGFPVVLFGVLPLPDFVYVDKTLAATLKTLHEWFAKGLAVLVLLHLAGALKHHFVDRDGLLRRMWF